jgi:hypothetical protein
MISKNKIMKNMQKTIEYFSMALGFLIESDLRPAAEIINYFTKNMSLRPI